MENNFKLSIEPGYSVNQCFHDPYWKFIIGMPLNQTLDIISNESVIFKRVDFLYSHKTPTYLDIIVTLIDEGINLYFDPKQQRLKKIEFNEFTKVSLMYCNSKFNDLQERPTKEQVMQVFGPAKVPEYDNESKCYLMCYTGLSFYLDRQQDTSSTANVLGRGMGYSTQNQYIVKRLSVVPRDVEDLSLVAECFKEQDTFLNQLCVYRDNYRCGKFEFHLLTVDDECGKVCKLDAACLKFGDNTQQVMSALGAPSRIFYKTEDRVRVPAKNNKFGSSESDYFYNYLNLGIDIMFRFETNTISKFILHTNFPDDFLFNTYYRCFFSIELEKDQDKNETFSVFDNNDDVLSSKFTINSFSKWYDVKSPVERRVDHKPVEVSRFQDQCHKSGVGSHTLAYGVDDLIFEVMPENDHISSVTLYEVN